MAGDRRDVHEPTRPPAPAELLAQPTFRLLLAGGALCNDTAVTDEGALIGDPTETALVAVAAGHGLGKRDLEAALPRVFELPFDSDRKRMTTVHRMPARLEDVPASLRDATTIADQIGDPGVLAFTKGAVDGLLPRCSTFSVDGHSDAFDDEHRRRARDAAEGLAAEGVRVLGVAMRRWPDLDAVPRDDGLEDQLTFTGLVGMIDPARPEVRDAIATCHEAGVRVVMITGDHPLTAAAIGRDLGLVDEGGEAMTGAELGQLDAAELDDTVGRGSIYARVSPEDKIGLVKALQRRGEVVAMTGDGVNDAPALEQAHIGVAMGITGTDVTKDAADMVLQDDNFATIVAAVREGRVVFDNIRKFIRNIMSGNLAEVAIMVLGPILGMPIPLLPLQILWLNLITDGLPAMAMAVEPAEPGVMRRPPTPLGESLLGADRGRRILTRGAVLTALVLVPAYLLWDHGDDAWQTVLFSAVAFAELAGGFAMRSERVSLRRLGVLGNRAMLGAVGLTVALQVVLVTVPFPRDLFDLEALAAGHWLGIVGIALAYAAAVETEKWASHRWRSGARGEPAPA
jgi:Ca2+-transporting ATPase